MRSKVTVEKLHQFMRELADSVQSPGGVYFAGGATALLLGFREQTLDVDLKLDPEPAGVFEAIARLKGRLNLNVELATPGDFIPQPPDWRERSQLITREGPVSFFHYDFSLQVLAKLERAHAHDLEDATDFLRRRLVTPEELKRRFEQIEPDLQRFPAIDPADFRKRLEDFLRREARS